jgi:hypothetical protein
MSSRHVGGAPVDTDVMLLSVSQHASALLQQLGADWLVLGSLSLPSSSFAGDSLNPSARKHEATVYGQKGQGAVPG